ncbi:hypothetical protein SAMN02910275_01528 [Butyrivibrio sp. INlla18]|jgi:hypothetical protein|uniref:hypothetical protein n=1 Tax=unclassified Butyrivibrio TaxID=2639466 RepID=UPI0008918622|nr:MULTISPECIES: hypothetical protein [unclassified Butyrivibrio]MBE5840827.1 hypothetical protein [Butyrivibrio sp.]SDA60660.1 hypothetical protein SAMN02910275_01528 [Butyrivibrio sp. INlla18]
MMENDRTFNENSIEDIVSRYRPEVDKLMPHLHWLKENAKHEVAQSYSNSDLKSMPFPIYDSNLLAFVKAAQSTNLLDRNYVYVYTRNRLANAKDEILFIQNAEIKDMDDLAGILSKYILSGMTKGTVWAEGVYNGVLYMVVNKMDELLKMWAVKV